MDTAHKPSEVIDSERPGTDACDCDRELPEPVVGATACSSAAAKDNPAAMNNAALQIVAGGKLYLAVTTKVEQAGV